MKLFLTKKFGDREYTVFLPLMWLTVGVLMFIALYGLNENNWSLSPNYYSECKVQRGCHNDFANTPSCVGSPYENESICTQEWLAYGEVIGKEPSFVTQYSNQLTILSLVVFIVLNTVFFNKSLLKDLKLGEE